MIDIIIPAYNAHDTIYKTLMSISLQVIKDKLKVYIIDDCSDKTYDYLKKDFKNLNLTIKRLDKNIGPGLARNIGLEISDSDFIFFLDSDDMITNEFSLRTIYNNIEDNDLIYGNIEYEQEDGNIKLLEYDDVSLHAKLYRRSFLDKYNIRFPELYRHEDRAFHEICLINNPRICFIDEYVYFYRFNKKSLTREKTGYEEFKNFKSLSEGTQYMIECGINTNANKEIMIEKVSCALMYTYYMFQHYYNEDYSNEIYEWINPLVDYYLKNKDNLAEGILDNFYDYFKINYSKIPYISWYEFIDKASK